MRKIYVLFLIVMLACIGCQWHLSSSDNESEEDVVVERYDLIESLYLTTGDYSALQQMSTEYPQQTRTLIEDVLRIGKVDDTEINNKFLRFYQDSTLQALIAESELQYANMDDINSQLTSAFNYLDDVIPNLERPEVYAQIGSLDQSIIVGNNTIGICLDKYLGTDYPLYQRAEYGYKQEQLQMMTRQYIVPDCVGFYLFSIYPLPIEPISQAERDVHMGRIQWVVNQAIGYDLFENMYVQKVERFMSRNKNMNIEQLLSTSKYSDFL